MFFSVFLGQLASTETKYMNKSHAELIVIRLDVIDGAVVAQLPLQKDNVYRCWI